MTNYERFIEVHFGGQPWLINLDHVEQIVAETKGSTIYFAFNIPNGVDQDFLRVDEDYEALKRRIWGEL